MVLRALPGPGTAAAGKSVLQPQSSAGLCCSAFSAPESQELVLHNGEIFSGEPWVLLTGCCDVKLHQFPCNLLCFHTGLAQCVYPQKRNNNLILCVPPKSDFQSHPALSMGELGCDSQPRAQSQP